VCGDATRVSIRTSTHRRNDTHDHKRVHLDAPPTQLPANVGDGRPGPLARGGVFHHIGALGKLSSGAAERRVVAALKEGGLFDALLAHVAARHAACDAAALRAGLIGLSVIVATEEFATVKVGVGRLAGRRSTLKRSSDATRIGGHTVALTPPPLARRPAS
jgi:hypothetical protein